MFSSGQTFHHVALVYQSGGFLRYYVDGENKGSGPPATNLIGIYDLVIGEPDVPDTVIDEIWISKSVVPVDEIITIYNNQKGDLIVSN